jgi:predicted AlkP superfamily pyrophosphatase or phosphodiesterase
MRGGARYGASVDRRVAIDRGARVAGVLGLALLAASVAARVAADATPTPAPPASGAPIVILLSLDGIRPDYLDRAPLPAFARMTRDGARADRLVPVFPSTTFPNHVSLATGTYVDRHGVVGMRFTDPAGTTHAYAEDPALIRAEPLWSAAERQGVAAATFFWVGSEGEGGAPPARYRRLPFDDGVPEADKVAQILAWLDLPEADRPRLIMSWWHGADAAGHRHGPDHPAVTAAVVEQDVQLGRLLAGLDARCLWARTTVLVVSDHGMTRATTPVPVEDALARAGIVARVDYDGGHADVFLADPRRRASARAALDALDGVRAYDAETVPAHFRSLVPGRTGDVILVAEPPFVLTSPGLRGQAKALIGWARGDTPGTHGHDPAHPDMHAIFLALGRGVPAGATLGAVRAIDVAPTAAALLGIAPPAESEGRAMLPR